MKLMFNPYLLLQIQFPNAQETTNLSININAKTCRIEGIDAHINRKRPSSDDEPLVVNDSPLGFDHLETVRIRY